MKSKPIVSYLVMGWALSACAMSPLDGGTISGNQTSFNGFAIEPNAPVRVQALLTTTGLPDPDLPSATWHTLTPGNLKASGTASSLSFSRPLYGWNASVTVPDQYFRSGATFLRAQQFWGGAWVPMYSYDQRGLDCLVNRCVEASNAGHPLDVDDAGIQCSRDPNGKDLQYVELTRPGLKPDLVPDRFDSRSIWLIPDSYVTDGAVLHPVAGGPPAELLCSATWMNIAFGYRNVGNAVAVRRLDRVSIPALGLADIDEQPRLRSNWSDIAVTNDMIVFPPKPGRYASFDLRATVPNQVYTVAFDINHDHALPESDFNNNHAEITFMRKCP